jgi:hypothetical protein
MVTTESDLQYKDNKVGQGPSPPVGYQVCKFFWPVQYPLYAHLRHLENAVNHNTTGGVGSSVLDLFWSESVDFLLSHFLVVKIIN